MSIAVPNEKSNNFYPVGWVSSAHGIKGELYIRLRSKQADWFEKFDHLYLFERDSDEMTFESVVKAAKPHKQGLIVKVEALKDRTHAETFKGHTVKIPRSYLTSQPGENFYLAEIEGFELQDKLSGITGRVVGFSTNTVQDLLLIQTKEGSFDVPLVPEFIETIDFEAERIVMNLPEGLLEKL